MQTTNRNNKRLLTGDRPTGELHLGHLVGSLHNRVALQQEYECYFLIADLHMLTTRPTTEDIQKIGARSLDMVVDYLSVGIDPTISTIYLQSAVPEVCELAVLLGMHTTVPRLQRLPSLKEMKEAAHMDELTYGLLGYPVLQSADILLPRASIVPVGKDNAAHIELCREVARRFNMNYQPIFDEPRALIGTVPTLVGIDGAAKMSKSLDNSISLRADEKEVTKRVMRMYTDPQRVRADIPGRVDGNPLFIYHDIFNANRAEVDDLKERYRLGKVGDVEVKQKLSTALNAYLRPIRERRQSVAERAGYAAEIIYTGTIKMREIARDTIHMVRKAMGLTGAWNRISRTARKQS